MKHPSDIEDLPVLPPGMDQISQTTFGHLTLEIGKILSFKDKHYQKEDIRVRAKFWGEQGPGKIYRVLNANGQMIQRYPNKRVYKVCCQMEQFYKYLEDMSKLHLTLIDKTDKSIGFSVIDISSNLKPSLGFGEFSPLEQDNQILAIYSKNKKEQIEIGQLEANISCEFDPNLSQFLHEYPQSSTSTFTQIKGSEEEMTKKGPQGKKEDIKIRNEIFQEVGQDEDGKENKNINKDESQQRVALSLFEAKKEKLEYQSKKFLDKVENKISIGNELLNDIWVNEDYEEEEVKVINPLVFKNEVKKNDRNNKTLLEDILSEKDEETDRQPYSKNNFEDINKYKNQEDISLSCRTDQLESPEDYLPQQPIDKQKEEEREDQLKKVNMDDQLEFKQLDQQFSLSGINHLKNLEQKVDRLLSVGQMIFKDNQQKMNGGEEDDGDEELAVPYFSDLPKKIIQKNQEKKVSNNTKVSSNLNQNKDHPKQLIEYNIPQAQEIHSRIFQQQQQSINSSHLQETIELKLPKNDSLPSPLSEHFKQASRWESLELTVLEFNCLHDHLLSKFKQRNIFLACDVPSSFSSKSPPLRDSYKYE